MNYNSQQWTPNPQDGQPQPYAQPQQQAPASLIELNNKPLHTYDRVKAGEATTTIRQADQATKGDALARVYVRQDAPTRGRTARPPFTVNGPADGSLLCSVQPVGDGVYDVYAGDGTPLGRITRGGGALLPWPRRVRWTVQAGQVGEPLSGKVGTVNAWVWMVVLSPIYFVIWAIMGIYGLLERLLGEKEDLSWQLEPPSHTLWRVSGGGGIAMRTQGLCTYRIESQQVDHRLAYVQAVLHAWDRR